MSTRTLPALAAAVLLAGPGLAQALPTYSAMYVFGDSLSDRGNLADGFRKTFDDPPSFHNSFTNGPVAVSVLAARLGLTADASLWLGTPPSPSGTNYAVGGATSQLTTPNGLMGINLPDQVNAYLTYSSGMADPQALYTVFIGGNDVRDATLPGGGGAAAIASAVTTETAQISSLLTAGARKLLVVNVTDVGAIPQFALENPALAPTATAYTEQYDAGLASALAMLATPAGTDITNFNLLGYNRTLLAHASQFGITDTTDPCWVISSIVTLTATPTAACGPGAANIGQFAFWNDVHPTSEVHAIIGDGFLQALEGNPNPSPIPEPASIAALAAGLLATLGLRRPKRRRWAGRA